MSSPTRSLILIALADVMANGSYTIDRFTVGVTINNNTCSVVNHRFEVSDDVADHPDATWSDYTPKTRLKLYVDVNCPAIDDSLSIKVTGNSYIKVNTVSSGSHTIPISQSVDNMMEQLIYAREVYLPSYSTTSLPPLVSEHYDTAPLNVSVNLGGMQGNKNMFWGFFYTIAGVRTFIGTGLFNPFYKVLSDRKIITDMMYGLDACIYTTNDNSIRCYSSVTDMRGRITYLQNGTIVLKFDNPLVGKSFSNACLAGLQVGKKRNNDPNNDMEFLIFGFGSRTPCDNPVSVTFTSDYPYIYVVLGTDLNKVFVSS